MSALASLGLACCTSAGDDTDDESSTEESTSSTSSDALGENPADMSAVTIDPAAWCHDLENDVYYQLGVQYCSTPAALAYEAMGVYVPGAYFDATDNGDGTFTCSVSTSGAVGGYTAATAPVVLPVNTPGYSAQEAPTTYSADGLTDYLDAGLVYVLAGCRGRASGENDDGTSYAGGAPWGVTDLKAAIRCIRYNAAAVPGDKSRVFTFGHSGGGAQSALVGATGDSALYASYLKSIGAIFSDADGNAISDSTRGAMCWCPITALDEADEAYEWMMGQYFSEDTRAAGTFTKLLSDDLSDAFVSYVNSVGLTANGGTLNLSEGGEGLYTAGTYYDYLQSVIEDALDSFLADTRFPYTATSSAVVDVPDDGASKEGGSSGPGDTRGVTTTYETVGDYVASLNADEEWVSYDASTNTAAITSVGAFVRCCKPATKDVGAFDALDRSQTENQLFGDSVSEARHFDKTMTQLLSEHASDYGVCPDFSTNYANGYATDIASTDSLGTLQSTRVNMYNPMYFLLDSYTGYDTSRVAPYWRIRTGIDQSDTSLTTEVNLALALVMYSKSVDFETVWGQGHTMAERTGDSTSNLIKWIAGCA